MSTDTSRVSLTVISSMATRHVLTQLADAYEATSGQRVSIVSVGGVEAARRIQEGERFDVVVLASDALDRLERDGHIVSGSRVDVARSEVAVAIKHGEPRRDISSGSAVRDAVLRARTIGYSTGPSGTHIINLLRQWGIADVIADRIVEARPGVPVGSLIAEGKVELGFQQLSELVHQPGIDIIGMLPAAIQAVTVFSAAICATSERQEAARAFLNHLASADGDRVKIEHGMAPV
ncbi:MULTISPECIES: substrate-binding domain-containing protein [Paraburkholderia]|uniref:substrate-binding domain-containing protein n=1 Tax=Paraburkholderia TaxID=1822464 RepID=UPI001CB4D49C|nr:MULTISPECIES: substrate-binding domain-containing protein [Paraburkholderia]GJH01331.1 substrate-binding domain-containing protein [Paraburkholderia terrae]CAG9247358.1 Putative ABC transport system, periplasmic component protein [Paraburkholderia caribensis]